MSVHDADPIAGIEPPATGFDPFTDAVRRDPYPHYHWLLRNDPVHRGAHGMWYVSRYADVRHVMSDTRFGRAGFRTFWSQLVGPGPLSDILAYTVFFQDPPDHTRLRQLIHRAFSPRIVNALDPWIVELVDELLEPVMERGEMDVIYDFAYPLPLTVIAQLLGIPGEDRGQFRDWSLAIGPTIDTAVAPDLIERGQVAMGEFADYMRGLFPAIRRSPRDDLLSALLQSSATENEVICMAISLVIAGHETTTNLIGNGLLALLRAPDQLELLRADPARIANAVEECLRYDSPVQQNTREVQEETELEGRTFRKGELVVALQGAANRDPAQFERPDELDVQRTNILPMSFGAGKHFCLGAPLARLEGRIALSTLLERMPGLALAKPAEELTYEPSTLFRGLTALPIQFDAA